MYRWPVDEYEVIHLANTSDVDIAQRHNGILDIERCNRSGVSFRYRGETYRDAQARGLREIVLAAFEKSVSLLSWRLGGLSPIYEAEEEGSGSVVRLEKQGLLEIFCSALQWGGL